MSRSRRRPTRMKARRRGPPLDWVYRGTEADEGGALDTTVPGTYGAGFFSLASGTNMVSVLVDSQNYLNTLVAGATPFKLPMAARPSGRRPYCHTVSGFMELQASTWAAGNDVRVGWRIGVFEQDPDTGLVELDVAYNMWLVSGVVWKTTPDVWANDQRNNRWERRMSYHFAAGNETSMRNVHVLAHPRVSLGAHECLALYCETAPSSVGIRWQTFLRTLMSDEGSG